MSEPIEPATLTRSDIGSLYCALMEQLKARLGEVWASLRATQDPSDTLAWLKIETGYLQIRKICESVAIAVLAAHNEFGDFRSKAITKEWNASALFSKLLRLNEHAFPRPAVIKTDFHGEGRHHVEMPTPELDAQGLSEIYGACGDRLHVGSLRRVLDGKQPLYDRGDLIRWHNSLIGLLSTHLILLPEIRSTLLVVLNDVETGQVKCIFGDAEGPSILIPGPNRLDFELDAAQ